MLYEVPKHVQATIHDSGAVLLNVRNGRVYALNESGARLWALLAGGSQPSEIVEQLSEEWEGGRQALEAHLVWWISALTNRGLLTQRNSGASTSMDLLKKGICFRSTMIQNVAPAEPMVKREATRVSRWRKLYYAALAFVAFGIVDVVLRAGGYRGVRSVVRLSPRVLRNVSHHNLEIVRSAVNEAAAFYFKHPWCLQRSAVLVMLLRLAGIDAELVVGIRTPPFAAHAWVEVTGAVINDGKHLRQLFEVIDVV